MKKSKEFVAGDTVKGRFNPHHSRGTVLCVDGCLILVKWEAREFNSWMVPSDVHHLGDAE
jgi:hypothetical protein